MGRPSNTDARREQIARALRRVLARHGYDGASVALVARAAGLAPGLVHYHFRSKLEILLALVGDLAAEHSAGVALALEEAGDDPRRQVEAFVDRHLALETGDPEALACWVAISGEALRQPRVRRAFESAVAASVDSLAAVIRRGVARRVLRCARPREAACALVAAIQGYFVLAAAAPGLVPRGSAAGAVRRMAAGLLAPRLPSRRGARP